VVYGEESDMGASRIAGGLGGATVYSVRLSTEFEFLYLHEDWCKIYEGINDLKHRKRTCVVTTLY
jgi:hypothetical protein